MSHPKSFGANDSSALETDELFEVKSNFYLGAYQAAINDASALGKLSDAVAVERDAFIYRSWIALGNHQLVIDEIPTNAPFDLQVIKMYAAYLKSEQNRNLNLEKLNECLVDDEKASSPLLKIVLATIYFHEGNLEEALRLIHNTSHLEGYALLVQILIKMNLVGQAEKHAKTMQQIDDDATLTQLAQAWVNLAQGGDKIQEAVNIFQDLSEKNAQTTLILNGLAACYTLQKKFPEAERYLLESLEKNPKDPETLINLVSSMSVQGKQASRYLNQVRLNFPDHPWVVQLARQEELFTHHAQRFAV